MDFFLIRTKIPNEKLVGHLAVLSFYAWVCYYYTHIRNWNSSPIRGTDNSSTGVCKADHLVREKECKYTAD